MSLNGNLRCTCIMTRSCNKWKHWSKTCTTYSKTVKKFANCIKNQKTKQKKAIPLKKMAVWIEEFRQFPKNIFACTVFQKKKF